MELQGKVALVLGGGKGIGKEIGFALANQGASVIMTYYDWPEESAEMVKQLERTPGDHLAVQLDLREPEEIEKLFQQIEAAYECLAILINNIERGGMPVVHGEYTSDQWDLEMSTTLKAKRWVFNRAMPLLKRSGAGCVINISSIAGEVGRSGPASLIFNDGYSAANRAVSLLTETWAREGAPEVRVNELMLGFFETRHAEGTRGWSLLSDQDKNDLIGHILLERYGTAEDVIRAVNFLVRDAEYMTGTVIRLDGGYVLGGNRVPPMPEGVD